MLYGSLQKRREAKRCIYHSKNKLNEQLERKINENGNRKLFWNGAESCGRVKDGNGR